jgi:hypothetical protein
LNKRPCLKKEIKAMLLLRRRRRRRLKLVEGLPSMYKALSSIPSTGGGRKREGTDLGKL